MGAGSDGIDFSDGDEAGQEGVNPTAKDAEVRRAPANWRLRVGSCSHPQRPLLQSRAMKINSTRSRVLPGSSRKPLASDLPRESRFISYESSNS